ncbi:Gfo/Idh/MocA family oxidoreductase [Roseovarius sp. EGI FJ00037]|uniref:Gfo/Idh/MocA family protein n=1 Tax=Roseovarius TaxID=74030 RepID=UPI0022A6AF60|nr:Gfo/Idh/MocA family oxidoreductase [Roseovarius sp. EGI FJ00037]MCZ0811248.1 Gfo/Idh/MocA family oxidoreductase [Roseovarius sp. EGI FJ00037]
MTQPIRLGIAGTGRMAARMVQALTHAPDITVAAIASGDGARARWFADQCGVADATGDLADMVQNGRVDAVYVAGRTRDHAAAALQSVQASKPVLVEKPLALTPGEARRLAEAARESDCLVMENLWCLALPAYRALCDQLSGGAYGSPVHLHFDFGYPVKPESHASLFDPEDGGVILDRAVYGVALALNLLGPVTDVDCSAQRNDAGVDVMADLRLRHQSGALSHVAVALNALMSNTASLACTHGHLGLGTPVIGSEILTACQMLPQAAAEARPGAQAGLKDRIRAWPRARKFKRKRDMSAGRFLGYGTDPYLPVLTHFVELIRDGQGESGLIPLDLSIRTLEILQHSRGRIGES